MMIAAIRLHGATIAAVALAGALVSTTVSAQAPATPDGLHKTWEGTAGAGLSLTSGNSDTVTYNLAFDLVRAPGGRNVMQWTGLHLRGTQGDDFTVNRTSLGYRDEYTLTGRMFLFGQLDYLRDTFKLIDYLVAPTAGVGYKVIATEPTSFSVDVGAGGVWEKNPGITLRKSGALTAGEQLTHQLTSTAVIKHAATGLWKTNNFADGLYTLSLGLATKISDRAQFSIDLLDTFKNRPPTAATKKNDVAIVTAITATY